MATPDVSGAKAAAPDRKKLIEAWIDESVSSAPPPAQMHLSTHLKACLPALLEKLK